MTTIASNSHCANLKPLLAVLALALCSEPFSKAAIPASEQSNAADALLDRCIQAEGNLKSLQANYRRETRAGGKTSVLQGSLQLRKPDFALIRLNGSTPGEQVIYRADRLNFVTYRPAKKEYFSQAADGAGRHAQAAGCVEAGAFFDPALLRMYRRQAERAEVAGPVPIDGQSCSDLALHGAPGSATFHLYIGADGLLRGMRSEVGTGLEIESRLSHLRTSAPIPLSVFAWKPPAEAKPSAGSVCRFALSDTPLDPALTAVGRTAPDFPITPVGSDIKGFSSLLRKHRLVVLNFWGFG